MNNNMATLENLQYEIMCMLNDIKFSANHALFRSANMALDGDEEHVKLIETWRNKIKAAKIAVEEIELYGFLKGE